MMTFKEFLKLENLWGNVPVKGRKPSDGHGGGGGDVGGAMPAAMPAAGMMKKKMKKKMKKTP